MKNPLLILTFIFCFIYLKQSYSQINLNEYKEYKSCDECFEKYDNKILAKYSEEVKYYDNSKNESTKSNNYARSQLKTFFNGIIGITIITGTLILYGKWITFD